jgi:hypothetical protein
MHGVTSGTQLLSEHLDAARQTVGVVKQQDFGHHSSIDP